MPMHYSFLWGRYWDTKDYLEVQPMRVLGDWEHALKGISGP